MGQANFVDVPPIFNLGGRANTEEAIRKIYENASNQLDEYEVHARHILVDSEDDAKRIATDLRGGDSAQLAKKVSKDPAGSDGGDLGYFTKDQLPAEFTSAAFALNVRSISSPIKTQFALAHNKDRREAQEIAAFSRKCSKPNQKLYS